jgi:hypothetical protein
MSGPRKLDPAIASMLHGLANASQPEVEAQRDVHDQKIALLRDRYRCITRTDPAQFRPGDLVRWQPGLKNTRIPTYGETMVVVECFDPPCSSEVKQSGSTHFREPLTLLLGTMHEGMFTCWHFDGRRFERTPTKV